MIDFIVQGAGAYPGFERGGCLRSCCKYLTRAKRARFFFATSPTNCACASSTWLLLLVGVVDVGCPAQFNISGWRSDGDHDHDDGAIRARSKLAST